MSLALSFLRRDFLIATSYRMAFAMQLLSILLIVPLLYYMGTMFANTDAAMLEPYGGDYFAFLLIGVALLDYHAVSLRSFSQSLRDSQMMGTLELVLLSPTPLAKVLLFSSLYAYISTTIRFILYLIIGLTLGVDLSDANLFGALVVLFLGIIGFSAFGVISASAIMVFKRGMGINSLVSYASLFFGGVLFSHESLPVWLQPISLILPLTHTLEGMRTALLQGASFIELLPQIQALILFAVILMPISLCIFWASVRRTKVTGTLAQY